MSSGDWKKTQENTFTKWVNSSLKGHLTSNKNRVTSLQTDLEDGIILAELLVYFAKDNFRYVREPRQLKFKSQKLENLGVSFRFMESKEIKLVNIGPEDIYNGNLKLILGLIWTLIRRYQIRSTGRALSTKNAMLAWINTQIPDQNIKNFTTNWNDGIALCALVDRIRPGLIPHYATLSRSNKIGNCTLGMNLAQEKLEIPSIMDAEDLCHPDIDEISMMTYISYFCKPANAHLLRWVQAIIPSQNIQNFTTDWNNGINLACLLEALNPRGFTDWNKLDPHSALDNLTRGMKAANNQLGIEPVLKPSEMADPSVDELNIVTYLSRFQNAKPLPQPQAIICTGEGLSKAIVGKPATFEVDTSGGGTGDLAVAINCSREPIKVDLKPKTEQKTVFAVQYIPELAGNITITVKWSGTEIPSSPYSIDVIDPKAFASKCKVKNRSGKDVFIDSQETCHLVRTPFEVGVYTAQAGSGSLTATGLDPTKSQLRIFTSEESDHGEKVTYIKFDPVTIGTYSLSLCWNDQELKGCPYIIHVIDPKRCTFKDAFPSFIRVGEDVTYEIDTSNAGDGEIEVFSGGPEVKTSVINDKKGVFVVVLSGVKLGQTYVDIKFGGHTLTGSTFPVSVCDPTKCTFDFEAGTFNVNKAFTITLKSSNAGRAKLRVTSSKKCATKVSNLYNSTWEVAITPKEIGEHLVQIFWGEWEITGSPISFLVCDPLQVKVSGLPDPSDLLMLGVPVTFSLDHSKAGPGSIVCCTKSSDGIEVDAEREETDGGADIAAFSFIPKQPGKMTIILEYNGVNLLPRLYEYEVPDPSKFKVTPPKGYGKIKEYVKFGITGVKDESEVTITSVHPEHNATVKTERGSDSSTIIARFTPKQIGDYAVEVKHAGQHIDGSPFIAQVANPDACLMIGKLQTLIHVGEEPKFKFDVSKAGPGALSFETEVISGIEDTQMNKEGDTSWVVALEDGVGKLKVFAKWAGYEIQGSPFILTIVDSQRVTWSCDILDKDATLKQGQLVQIILDCSEAGDGHPEVIAKGPEAEYQATIKDNEDGSYAITLTPWQIGTNEVKILWGGRLIPNMPVSFEVMKNIEAKGIMASGDGLTKAVANVPCSIMINGIEVGLLKRGLLEAHFEGEQDDLPSVELKDKGDGVYTLTFTAAKEGTYTLVITYDGQNILNSPFTVPVLAAPDSAKCKVLGEAFEKDPAIFVANDPVKFTVDTTEAGTGNLTVSASQPNGDNIRVYTMEEEGLHYLKFDPAIIGHYNVEVKWDRQDISGSPFDFNVVDPTKCLVSGIPTEFSVVQASERMIFTVMTKEVGECTPNFTIESNGIIIDLETTADTDPSEGIFKYKFEPDTAGKVILIIKIAGMHVPGSPFNLTVVDSNQLSIAGLNLTGDYAIVCEPVQINVVGVGSDDDDLIVTAHGPSADLNVDVTEEEGKGYVASFVPIEPGSYEVFVEFAGRHVRGSPFTIKVTDPSKCQILGGPLSILQMRSSEEITVKTRGAGEGKLEALAKNVDESNPALDMDIKDLGLDTYTVTFNGKAIGYTTIDLQWGGFTIPSCPFMISVCDATKCIASGEVLTSKKGKAGSAVSFAVETAQAGEAQLEVVAKGPSAQYTMTIEETEENKYGVSFTPWEIGEHKIEVLWGKAHITDSPFSIIVGSPLEMEVCNATGDGLKHAIASKKATFMIISSEVGLLDKDVLKVTVTGITVHADVTVTDNNNGCYTVDYIPPSPGAFVASILFHDHHIPGSPFKLTVDPGPDASKCKAYGPALHPNSLAIAGSPLEFFVETAEAGYGDIKVYIQGPNDYRPKVFMANDDQGVYSIKFDAMKAGKYFAVVVWSDKHIPKSPFKIRVHPAADASKVKAFGPGLLDSFIGTPGQYTIETKNAGIGTLLIRVHGLKDSFKIEAQPLSDEDARTLIVAYNPRLVAEYTIFVRWSGVHIPGSPFTVYIKQKPGSHDPAAEPVRVKSKRLSSPPSSPDKKGILDSSFAKAAPKYDNVQHKKGDRRKRARPSSTSSSKTSGAPPKIRPHSSAMNKTPSGGAIGVGPIGPSMKMKENPAIMVLARSVPPGYQQGGYVSGVIKGEGIGYTGQRRVVRKKVVKRVVHRPKRSFSSEVRSRSQQAQTAPRRAISPGAVQSEAVRKSRATSPPVRQPRTSTSATKASVRSAASPSSKALSPPRKPTSSVQGARSPTRKIAAKKAISPARKAAYASPAQKATSPARKAISPEQKATSPARKATSPARKATSPARKATSPTRKATSPAPKVASTAPKDVSATAQEVHPVPKAASPVPKAASPVPKAAAKTTSPAQKATSPARKAVSPSRRVKSPPRKGTSPAPKGGHKKKADPSRAKSPPRRGPPPKGKAPPPKKAAKQRK